MAELPYIIVKGDARERGLALGAQLLESIHKTYNFYSEVIFQNSALSHEQIRDRVARVKTLIHAFEPEFITELEAMAEAADIESWKIYALNARTEILNAPLAECTSLYFQKTALLGQTWDWMRELEDLVVLVRHEYADGRIITTFTEPGMLAKIGMNNSGLGVCLNFLESSSDLNGVPVHVCLRAILDCRTLSEAREKIDASGMGKSSHFLIADAKGQCIGLEYAANQRCELEAENDVLLHTNHCIGTGIESSMIPTSAERLACAREHLINVKEYKLELMQKILLDDSRGEESIQSAYHPEEVLGGLEVGTCATVMMDLAQRRLYLRKGPGPSGEFQTISVE